MNLNNFNTGIFAAQTSNRLKKSFSLIRVSLLWIFLFNNKQENLKSVHKLGVLLTKYSDF
jgi:hypothetical protein